MVTVKFKLNQFLEIEIQTIMNFEDEIQKLFK